MSLNHVLANLGLVQRQPDSLEAQLDSLRRDIRRIGQSLSRQASATTDDWSEHITDFSRVAARQGAHLAEFAGQQAWRGAKAVKRDPLPAIAIAGTALLLARLLSR